MNKKSTSYVYFMKCEQYVKIGSSTDIKERLADLSTGNPFPISILAVLEGSQKTEKELHKKYADYRLKSNSEWFHLSSEILKDLTVIGAVKDFSKISDQRPEWGDLVLITSGPYSGTIGEYDDDEEDNAIVIPHNREDLGLLVEVSYDKIVGLKQS